MRKTKNKILIASCIILGLPVVLAVILFTIGVYLYFTADFMQPEVAPDMTRYELKESTDSVKVCDYGSLCLNKAGLWEAKLHGSPIDRGAAYGVMSKELLDYQESVFVDQIHKIISSERWVGFLHKLIIIFNRDMARHIPLENREEIYAMSLSCTEKYDAYGSKYARQLNYHAAHDIGHAMQQYMLVGCSSFATWGRESENGELIIGRNFDFFVGDDFAKNKVILFIEPTQGYNFVSVSWPGMLGVLSGMNEKGLTVTINAAKGPIPLSSAMPISLLARRILQYASDISEAYGIAGKFETFVSESLLIGSAKDGCAAIIEKTPDRMALYKSPSTRVVCTNHYQSRSFASDKYHLQNIGTSDSPYRWDRINELLDKSSPIGPTDAVNILRNRYGKGDKDIGICNEKSINQYIAHHSVVFQPNELRMWVSTSPWQLGQFICYDLDEIFGIDHCAASFAIDSLCIGADSNQLGKEYVQAIRYRTQYVLLQKAIENHSHVPDSVIQDFINNNPDYFQVYNISGDYMINIGDKEGALKYYEKALSLEIPRLEEREQIIKKLKKYD